MLSPRRLYEAQQLPEVYTALRSMPSHERTGGTQNSRTGTLPLRGGRDQQPAKPALSSPPAVRVCKYIINEISIPEEVTALRARTPATFRFTAKILGKTTHERRLVEAEERLTSFLASWPSWGAAGLPARCNCHRGFSATRGLYSPGVFP